MVAQTMHMASFTLSPVWRNWTLHANYHSNVIASRGRCKCFNSMIVESAATAVTRGGIRKLPLNSVIQNSGCRALHLNDTRQWLERLHKHEMFPIRSVSTTRRRKTNAWICEYTERRKICDNQQQGASDSKESSGRKRHFALRLKGRTRLFLRSFKSWSPRLTLRDCLTYLKGRLTQVAFWSVFGCAIGVGCWYMKLTAVSSPQLVPYSELVSHLHAKTVTNALFEEGSRQVFFKIRSQNQNTEVLEPSGVEPELGEEKSLQGNVRPGRTANSFDRLGSIFGLADKGLNCHAEEWSYSTRRIENDETYILTLMRQSGVTYSSAPQSPSAALRTVLITIVTLWIPLSPLLWIMHRQLSGGSASGRRRRVNSQSVKFGDVAGVDDAKAELTEIVSFLQGATNFKSIGAKLPKGVLLVGPPGTGKTLLARAVAGEAGVPFFTTSASEFVEMFVGRGAARIRELFTAARKCAPSIIFIDELDAVGGRRGRSFNDERDQTLNQLLTEMDGFESDTGVLTIAATNRPEALDPALCRPGRFSRKVFVKEPDLDGRRQVLAVHMRDVPVQGDAEIICNVIASITYGFVGADLANVVNESALLAVRRGRSAVTLEDLKEAVCRVKYGVGNKPRINSIIEKELGRWFGWVPFKPSLQEDNGQSSLGYVSTPRSG